MNNINKGIDYSKIKIICPYTVKSIKSLKITEEINCHSTLFLNCQIDNEYEKEILRSENFKDKIEIKYSLDNGKSNDLFKGVITNITIKCIRDVFHLEIEAKSATYELDIKKHIRIFQDNNMLYKDLAKYILKNYKGSDFIDDVFNNNKIENLIVQYNETDWEFLKRIASHFNKNLIVNSIYADPKFSVGILRNSSTTNVDNSEYSIKNEMKKFNILKKNSKEEFSEHDFIVYCITDENYLGLGERIILDNKILVIRKVISEIQNELLKFSYEATLENSMYEMKQFNNNIIGNSIKGKVIEVQKDELKVNFDIDKSESKEKSMWFKYITIYSSEGGCGWYFMPEIGDDVDIYFPNNNEENVKASFPIRMNSIGNSKINDPNRKCIGTNKNKELSINKSEIKFNAKEGLNINLNNNGIEICSTSSINFDSKNNLTIKGNSISITGNETIHFVNGKSSLIMDGSTHTRGGKVYIL